MKSGHTHAPIASGLNMLEIRGALTMRLSHDLTNQLAVLAGHLLLMELTPDDAESRRKSIFKMREASEAAGGLIAQLNQFNSPIDASSTEQSSEALVSILRESSVLALWKLSNDWLSPAPLAVCARWIAGAIEYLAAQVRPTVGCILLTSNHANPAGGWNLQVQWSSAKPWLEAGEVRKPKEFGKAVVFELLQAAGGSVQYSVAEPNLNILQIHLPPI